MCHNLERVTNMQHLLPYLITTCSRSHHTRPYDLLHPYPDLNLEVILLSSDIVTRSYRTRTRNIKNIPRSSQSVSIPTPILPVAISLGRILTLSSDHTEIENRNRSSNTKPILPEL